MSEMPNELSHVANAMDQIVSSCESLEISGDVRPEIRKKLETIHLRQSELQKLSSENSEMTLKIEELEMANFEKESLAQELQGKVAELEKKLEEIDDENLINMEGEIDSLKHKIDQKEADYKAKINYYHEIHRAEIEKINEALDRKTKECDSLVEILKQKDQSIKEKNSCISESLSKQAEASKKCEKAVLELEQTKRKLVEQKEKMEKCDQVETELASEREKNQKLAEEVLSMSQGNQKLSEKLQRKSEKLRKLKKSDEELKMTEMRLTQMEIKLTMRLKELEEELEEKEKSLEQMKSELEVEQGNLETAIDFLNNRESELVELNEKHEALIELYESLESEMELKEKLLEKEKEEKAEWMRVLGGLEEKNEQLKEKNREFAEEIRKRMLYSEENNSEFVHEIPIRARVQSRIDSNHKGAEATPTPTSLENQMTGSAFGNNSKAETPMNISEVKTGRQRESDEPQIPRRHNTRLSVLRDAQSKEDKEMKERTMNFEEIKKALMEFLDEMNETFEALCKSEGVEEEKLELKMKLEHQEKEINLLIEKIGQRNSMKKQRFSLLSQGSRTAKIQPHFKSWGLKETSQPLSRMGCEKLSPRRSQTQRNKGLEAIMEFNEPEVVYLEKEEESWSEEGSGKKSFKRAITSLNRPSFNYKKTDLELKKRVVDSEVVLSIIEAIEKNVRIINNSMRSMLAESSLLYDSLTSEVCKTIQDYFKHIDISKIEQKMTKRNFSDFGLDSDGFLDESLQDLKNAFNLTSSHLNDLEFKLIEAAQLTSLLRLQPLKHITHTLSASEAPSPHTKPRKDSDNPEHQRAPGTTRNSMMKNPKLTESIISIQSSDEFQKELKLMNAQMMDGNNILNELIKCTMGINANEDQKQRESSHSLESSKRESTQSKRNSNGSGFDLKKMEEGAKDTLERVGNGHLMRKGKSLVGLGARNDSVGFELLNEKGRSLGEELESARDKMEKDQLKVDGPVGSGSVRNIPNPKENDIEITLADLRSQIFNSMEALHGAIAPNDPNSVDLNEISASFEILFSFLEEMNVDLDQKVQIGSRNERREETKDNRDWVEEEEKKKQREIQFKRAILQDIESMPPVSSEGFKETEKQREIKEVLLELKKTEELNEKLKEENKLQGQMILELSRISESFCQLNRKIEDLETENSELMASPEAPKGFFGMDSVVKNLMKTIKEKSGMIDELQEQIKEKQRQLDESQREFIQEAVSVFYDKGRVTGKPPSAQGFEKKAECNVF